MIKYKNVFSLIILILICLWLYQIMIQNHKEKMNNCLYSNKLAIEKFESFKEHIFKEKRFENILIRDLKLINQNGEHLLISKMHNEIALIIHLPNNYCRDCYRFVFELISLHFNKFTEKIIFIATNMSDMAIKELISTNIEINDIYRIKVPESVSPNLPDSNILYCFILDKEYSMKFFHAPNPSFINYSDNYFTVIREHFNNCHLTVGID